MIIDNEFDPEEWLYLRIRPEGFAHFLKAGVLNLHEMQFPDMSVNRGKYSKPEDVLGPRPEYGVAAFQVRDIPGPIVDEGREYTFRVEHDPREGNYSHSEVRSFRDGARMKPEEPNRTVRQTFRATLALTAKVIRKPAAYQERETG